MSVSLKYKTRPSQIRTISGGEPSACVVAAMVVLEQLVELRVPAELRGVPSKALDAHIHKKILKPLSSTPHKTLAVGDDKAHPDLLEVGATFRSLM